MKRPTLLAALLIGAFAVFAEVDPLDTLLMRVNQLLNADEAEDEASADTPVEPIPPLPEIRQPDPSPLLPPPPAVAEPIPVPPSVAEPTTVPQPVVAEVDPVPQPVVAEIDPVPPVAETGKDEPAATSTAATRTRTPVPRYGAGARDTETDKNVVTAEAKEPSPRAAAASRARARAAARAATAKTDDASTETRWTVPERFRARAATLAKTEEKTTEPVETPAAPAIAALVETPAEPAKPEPAKPEPAPVAEPAPAVAALVEKPAEPVKPEVVKPDPAPAATAQAEKPAAPEPATVPADTLVVHVDKPAATQPEPQKTAASPKPDAAPKPDPAKTTVVRIDPLSPFSPVPTHGSRSTMPQEIKTVNVDLFAPRGMQNETRVQPILAMNGPKPSLLAVMQPETHVETPARPIPDAKPATPVASRTETPAATPVVETPVVAQRATPAATPAKTVAAQTRQATTTRHADDFVGAVIDSGHESYYKAYNMGNGDPVDMPPYMTETQARTLALQCALDRFGFSVGLVDGVWGRRSQQALDDFCAAYQLSGEDATNLLICSGPFLIAFNLPDDRSPFIGLTPYDWEEASTYSSMPCRSILDWLADEFHQSPTLSARMNPHIANWEVPPANTVLRVVNVRPAECVVPAPIARIEIDTALFRLRAYDANDHMLLSFPCSIARNRTQVPTGSMDITTIAANPNYTFDPANYSANPRAQEIGRRLILPPGPRNPVGIFWLGLSRPGYGIHGTPNPSTIGNMESLGCFRLCNWDAKTLGEAEPKGSPVFFLP